MTKNQIEYNKLLETSRNNRVIEDLTRRRDIAAAEVARGTLTEQTRHNVASEAQAVAVLGETKRSNITREQLQAKLQDETKRHNTMSETISLMGAQETQRSHLAQEAEVHRSNTAREAETYRSNLAREVETHRSNTSQEAIARQRNAISGQQVQLGYSQLSESIRHSRQLEQLESERNAEVARSNQAKELENTLRRVGEQREAYRSHLAQETETQRHNQVVELQTKERQKVQNYVDRRNATSRRMTAYSDVLSSAARTGAMLVPLLGG